jgi:hypothetical protein
MTTEEKIIKNKVGLPTLAQELGNDRVIPFFDTHGILEESNTAAIGRIMSINCTWP